MVATLTPDDEPQIASPTPTTPDQRWRQFIGRSSRGRGLDLTKWLSLNVRIDILLVFLQIPVICPTILIYIIRLGNRQRFDEDQALNTLPL